MKSKYIEVLSTIYNVDIVIVNRYTTLEDLKEKYVYYDGVELDNSILDCQASTSRCKDKETGKPCIIVKDNRDSKVKGVNKKLDLINTAAHEAFHVMVDIYWFVGESIDFSQNNESSAYFIGWITQHIYEIWTKK